MQMKAKEKELKDEKESERQVWAVLLLCWMRETDDETPEQD